MLGASDVDIDSAQKSESILSTATIKSSIYKYELGDFFFGFLLSFLLNFFKFFFVDSYRFENGRRYHAYRDG